MSNLKVYYGSKLNLSERIKTNLYHFGESAMNDYKCNQDIYEYWEKNIGYIPRSLRSYIYQSKYEDGNTNKFTATPQQSLVFNEPINLTRITKIKHLIPFREHARRSLIYYLGKHQYSRIAEMKQNKGTLNKRANIEVTLGAEVLSVITLTSHQIWFVRTKSHQIIAPAAYDG